LHCDLELIRLRKEILLIPLGNLFDSKQFLCLNQSRSFLSEIQEETFLQNYKKNNKRGEEPKMLPYFLIKPLWVASFGFQIKPVNHFLQFQQKQNVNMFQVKIQRTHPQDVVQKIGFAQELKDIP
jgi:hypothetical protein